MSKKFTLIVEPLAGKSAPMFYKEDGTRFPNKHTVKLKVATEYCLRVTLTPPLSLDVMNVLLDEDATSTNSASILCGCAATEISRDQQKAVYILNWTIQPETIPVSSKNSRETLVLAFPMNLGEVRVKLQCKVYGEKSKKHQGGRRLNSLEQQFSINEQSLLDFSPANFLLT
ncbi:uncharacterized protein LOC134840614 [Symsagittifera roscoffensis]|uniref:uncharacterized protein LOC134840614 n=1 Tax=Symsagittifera roscoffensis TaxID=84072 RepID=UPI00307B926B